VGSAEKKRQKEQAKAQKKLQKAKVKAEKKAACRSGSQTPAEGSSAAVRFAETVRGILYLILAVSLVIAIILSDEGYIITLEDIFKSLALALVGKIILLVIAAAFFIYGLKHLRAVG